MPANNQNIPQANRLILEGTGTLRYDQDKDLYAASVVYVVAARPDAASILLEPKIMFQVATNLTAEVDDMLKDIPHTTVPHGEELRYAVQGTKETGALIEKFSNATIDGKKLVSFENLRGKNCIMQRVAELSGSPILI